MAKRVEEFEKALDEGLENHLRGDEWKILLLKELNISLAIIADSMDYNQSFDKACHEAAERL